MDVEERKEGQLTIGQKLREVRQAQGHSLKEVERAIKVHAHHLEALELGDHEALPNRLWSRGFLISYANYLGLDGEHLADELFPLQRPSRPQRYLKRHWRALVTAFGMIGIAAVVAAATVLFPLNPVTGWVGNVLHDIAPETFLGSEPQRILLLGFAQSATTDEDNVLMVKIAKTGVGLRSIPRDTLAEIPGHGRREIGDAFAIGGPDLTRRSVAQFTGAKVPYYCLVSTEGVREIVDSMGGVEINVPQETSGQAAPGGPVVTLAPGQQTLDGDQALVYLHGEDLTDDATRAKRQQDFLYVMFRQALGPLNLLANPSTLSVVLKNTETNMSGAQVVQLASRVRALKDSGAPITGS
jgi:polyisoprenyl-teichoic acid--peptidoglycan teichoic acid transferase